MNEHCFNFQIYLTYNNICTKTVQNLPCRKMVIGKYMTKSTTDFKSSKFINKNYLIFFSSIVMSLVSCRKHTQSLGHNLIKYNIPYLK